MQRFDFQVPIVVPLNRLNSYRNLLLSGGLTEFPNPFKRTTTFNELKVRYFNYCQSKNLAFHDPRPFETSISPNDSLGKEWKLEKDSRVIIKARENGIITIHIVYSFTKSLTPVEIRNLKKNTEPVLLRIGHWVVDKLKERFSTLNSFPNGFIAIGPALTYMFTQQRETIRKRKKMIAQISKFFGVYRPVFKGDSSIEDDEFSVSGKSFHLFWTQHHIRKKTRNKLIAGHVEAISLANGINEMMRQYTLPSYYSMSSDHSWEIFLNFLNPFILAGKVVQTPLLPANWRSWLIHCSKIYKLRESYRAILIHFVTQNQIPITEITAIYRNLVKMVTLNARVTDGTDLGFNFSSLNLREKFLFSILLLSERISKLEIPEMPQPLELQDSHTLSAITEWANFLKVHGNTVLRNFSGDFILEDLANTVHSLLEERKRLQRKYGNIQGENSVFDPFSFDSIKITLETLIQKGLIEASAFRGRGRGKDKKKYTITRNVSKINEMTAKLIDELFPSTILFTKEETSGISFKILV